MPSRRSATTTAVICVAICVCLGLAGCGGSSTPHPTTTSGSTTSSSTSVATTSTTTTQSEATPITSAVWTLPDRQAQRVRVSIYALRRAGSYLVLDFGLQCLTASGCPVPGDLSLDPFEYDDSSDYEQQQSEPSGVVLIDPANAEQYNVATNDRGQADTSAYNQQTLPASGETYLGWAQYAPPATSVTSLDVAFPTGGPVFTDVRISSGPAPVRGRGEVAPQAQPEAAGFSADSTDGVTLPVTHLTLTSGSDSQYLSSSQSRSSIALRGDVLFHFDRSNLTSKAHRILQSVAAQIKARARGTIEVVGYTDDIGTRAFNLGLSRRRARSVLRALRPLTPGVRYVSAGEGESDPVATNTTAAGRGLNRRVTISFAVKHLPKATAPRGASSHTSGALRFTSPTGTSYRVAIDSVRTQGRLLLAELNVTCVVTHGCLTGGDLASGTTTIPPLPVWQGVLEPRNLGYIFGDKPTWDTINGFYLLDPSDGQAYLAAMAGEVPVTSTFEGHRIADGDTFHMWAFYPAPPATTGRLVLKSPVSSDVFKVTASGEPEVQLAAG